MYSIANKMTQLLISTTDFKTTTGGVNNSKNGRVGPTTTSTTSQKSPATSSYKSVSDENDLDEKFFDAVDNSTVGLIRRDDSVTVEDEEDDRASCFFDTVTSRHQSESNSNMNTPLSPRQFHLSTSENCFDELDETSQVEAASSTTQEQPISRYRVEVTSCDDTSKPFDTHLESIADEEDDDDSDQTDAELETPWSFWIDSCARGASKDEYEAGIKLIQTVKTVQTFWSIINNIPDVSALPNNYNYHLMRDTRRPLWEDPENARGGLWRFKCKKDDSSVVWMETLLAAIGEQLSDCVSRKDEVIGISVGRRDRDDIVQIWNRDARYAYESSIVEKIKDLVPQVKFCATFYKAHDFYPSNDSSPHHHHHNTTSSGSNGQHSNKSVSSNHQPSKSSNYNHHHHHNQPYHSNGLVKRSK